MSRRSIWLRNATGVMDLALDVLDTEHTLDAGRLVRRGGCSGNRLVHYHVLQKRISKSRPGRGTARYERKSPEAAVSRHLYDSGV